jgi:septal ring factor EnvC (AmiA/AmiB activator)
MLKLLLANLPAVLSAIGALGLFKGLAKAYKTYQSQQRKDDAQESGDRSDRIGEQSKRIDSLRDRMYNIEKQQEKERKARIEAEVRNQQLQATIDAMSTKIDQLVAMVGDLRQEAGMDPLTEDEKENLRETPDFTKPSLEDEE